VDPLTCNSPIPYAVNSPKLTQVVTGKKFHYFKLRLYDIPRCFGSKKSWNREYAPAQQIYSDNPISVALRAAIQAEHSILYSNREGRDENEGGVLDRSATSFFVLLDRFQNTKSLFSPAHSAAKGVKSIFKPRNKKRNKLRIYTYVVLNDSIRFSECGAGTTVDMSSKHALHAGAATEVYYAGEFWVEEEPQGKVLYMDNNSGTFAPPKTDLFRMKFLMEANFPNIQIVILDFQDPMWKYKRGKE